MTPTLGATLLSYTSAHAQPDLILTERLTDHPNGPGVANDLSFDVKRVFHHSSMTACGSKV